jgi:hypothetical protein
VIAPGEVVIRVLDGELFHRLQKAPLDLLLGQGIRQRRRLADRLSGRTIEHDGVPAIRFRLFIHSEKCTTWFSTAERPQRVGLCPTPRDFGGIARVFDTLDRFGQESEVSSVSLPRPGCTAAAAFLLGIWHVR